MRLGAVLLVHRWPLRRQVVFSVVAMLLLFNAVIAGVAAVYMAGMGRIESGSSRRDVDRLMSAINKTLANAHGLLQQHARRGDTADVLEEQLDANANGTARGLLAQWLRSHYFARNSFSQSCWRFEFELLALYGPDVATGSRPAFAVYFPNSSSSGTARCEVLPSTPPPFFTNASARLLLELFPSGSGLVLASPGEPFAVTVGPVRRDGQGPLVGYMLWAFSPRKVLQRLADAVPACVSVFTQFYPRGLSSTKLEFDAANEWMGSPLLQTARTDSAERSRRADAHSSACPAVQLHGGSPHTTMAWAKLGDGVVVRADRARVVVTAGFGVVLPMLVAVLAATLVLSATYYALVEVLILRRIEAFTTFLARLATSGAPAYQLTRAETRPMEDALRAMNNAGENAARAEAEREEMEQLAVEELGGDGGPEEESLENANEIAQLGGALKAHMQTLVSGIQHARAALYRQKRENRALDLLLCMLNVINQDSAHSPLLVSYAGPIDLEDTESLMSGIRDGALSFQVLLGFCAREMSLENMHFLMDCSRLRSLVAESCCNADAIPLVADRQAAIREMYFADRGLGLNVSSRARGAALGFRHGDALVCDFALAEQEVQQTFRMDTRSRFTQSQDFRSAAVMALLERSAFTGSRVDSQFFQALLRYPHVFAARRQTFPGKHTSIVA
eukprot:m51a1_g5351 hypothetical protein (677) ;mRNA; f:466378-469199